MGFPLKDTELRRPPVVVANSFIARLQYSCLCLRLPELSIVERAFQFRLRLIAKRAIGLEFQGLVAFR